MSEHRKTCRRWNDVGHAHSLTFSCFKRLPFLSKDRSRYWMLQGIEKARVEHRFDVWAYVLMPKHVHLLIWPIETGYSISAILKTMKQSVSRKALEFVRQQAPEFLLQMEDRQPNGQVSHRFWQRGGGYDRNLTEPKSIWRTVDYIHTNPVRRQLCQHAGDWPWSSAVEWLHKGRGLLRVDRESIPKIETT